jgi:transposase
MFVTTRRDLVNREALEAMLAEGLSLEEIGRRVERHPSTVSYWLGKYGLEAANRHRHLARGEIDRDLLVTLVDAGMSVAEIANELDRSKGTVRHWLHRFGLRTRRTVARAERAVERGEGSAAVIEMTCSRHGRTSFKVRADGSGYRCLRCRAEAVSRRRRRVKLALIEEAGGACALCGYDRHPGALQFHHLDPGAKSFGLSERGVARSMDRARAEAQKCVLLCSNCHAEVEGGIRSVPV